MNFLHVGSPKTWYSIPGDQAFAFEEVVRTQAYGGNVDHLGINSFWLSNCVFAFFMRWEVRVAFLNTFFL